MGVYVNYPGAGYCYICATQTINLFTMNYILERDRQGIRRNMVRLKVCQKCFEKYRGDTYTAEERAELDERLRAEEPWS